MVLCKKINKQNEKVIVSAIFLPIILLIGINYFSDIPNQLIKTATYGYTYNPSSLYEKSQFVIISLYLLTTIYFLFKHFFNLPKQTNEKKQVFLILLGIGIPAITGIITEIIFPVLLQKQPISISQTNLSFFTAASFIAIKKYGFLKYTPKAHYDKILNTINEGIVIIDMDGIIKYINKGFEKISGYTESELVGKNSSLLLDDEENTDALLYYISNLKATHSFQTALKTKLKRKKIINITSTPYIENNGVQIGYILTIQDITRIQKLRNLMETALIKGEEKERERLANELHDGLGQMYAVCKMKISLLLQKINDPNVIKTTNELKDTITEIANTTRNLSHNLKTIDEKNKLTQILKDLIDTCSNNQLSFRFINDGEEPPLSYAIKINLYRIAQEFINNSIKYSNASLIVCKLNYTKSFLTLEMKDNGDGFDLNEILASKTKGLGIKNMKNRAYQINADFLLNAAPGEGTSISITVPYL
ncbi:MAG: hypothetical protein Kow0079_13610 [Vicingaceae bacterium]